MAAINLSGGPGGSGGPGLATRIYDGLRRVPLWVIVAIWTLPTFSLLVNSFRGRNAQRNSGFWQLPTNGTNPDTSATPGEAASMFEAGPVNAEQLTLENYETVFSASATAQLFQSLVNSAAITIPATIIPIAFACFAAYGFAWIDFKGRKQLFIFTVALLAIPLQVALLPLLRLYIGGAHWTLPFLDKTITLIPDFDLNGTATAVWLTHTGFAMPFAIFLLHNYISGLPRDLFESARIDGADHFVIFWRLVLPLSVPVLAAFAIFQFLWTWNDYLVAVTMIGPNREAFPTTIRIANLAGDFGRNEHLLPAAAFVQAFVPMVVFFTLQRFFVRGILAGSVKG
ncbi:MAG: carbohydrate ABC transporter permease [Actinomycetota bacterium]